MTILLVFLILVIMCCYYGIKETMQNIAKEKEKVSYKRKKISKKPIIISVIIGIASIIAFCICFYDLSNSYNTSEWDKLSDEEREWYNDNYGDGKLEDIDKAIEEYKENH